MNLLNLVTDLSRKNSNEWAGPCPFCGGRDRFLVWPEQGKGGRFLCRQCGKKGDAIDLLRERGMTYQQACNELGVEISASQPQRPLAKPERSRPSSPSAQWMNRATRFVSDCVNGADPIALEPWRALLARRFVTEGTAVRFGIGWNPRDAYLPCEDWGLEGNALRIPAGLVIPTPRKAGIMALKIRCADRDANPKYWEIRGSGQRSLILGKRGLPVVVVESELDAILVAQEAGDLVGVIASGGTSRPLDEDALRFATEAPRLLISTDFDETNGNEPGAGQKAFHALKTQFPNAEYFPPAKGKDPCEMHGLGVPVRLWIQCALKPETAQERKLPDGFPGSWPTLQKNLAEFPDLVPCPKTRSPWSWIDRKECVKCNGHIQCLKDLKPSLEATACA